MIKRSPPRASVTWEGPGQPIVLTVYDPDGSALATLPLKPIRALTLAQELLAHGISASKSAS